MLLELPACCADGACYAIVCAAGYIVTKY